jgi:transcriptional regulator with XRE-family HTH domain
MAGTLFFVKNLRRLRAARKLTRAALAAKAKLSPMHVGRLEAGRQDPTLGTVEKLARALRVPVEDLVK